MMKRLASLLLKYPRFNILALAGATLFFLFSLVHLQLDTSLETFVVQDDPDLMEYHRFKDVFGNDEMVVVAFRAEEIFEPEILRMIRRLSDEFEGLDYVDNVRSLTTVNTINGTDEAFDVVGLVGRNIPSPGPEMDAIRREATTNYIYLRDLVDREARHAAIVIEIRNTKDRMRVSKVVQEIRAILKRENASSGTVFYLAGDAVINADLGKYMIRDFFAFILPIYLIIAIILALTFRSVRGVFLPLATVGVCHIWLLGLLSFAGVALDNFTVGLSPLILCIALEDIIYIMAIFAQNFARTKDKMNALLETVSHLGVPCFLTSFTTVVGFSALALSRIPPIRAFGVIGSLGVVMTFFICIVLVPSVLLILSPPRFSVMPKGYVLLERFLSVTVRKIFRKKHLFWSGYFVLIAYSIAGISRIEVNTDYLKFFKNNSDIHSATKFIDENLAGTGTFELTLATKERGTVKNPVFQKNLEKLVAHLRSAPEIDKAISIDEFLKDMNKAMNSEDDAHYKLPKTREEIAQYLLLYGMSDRRNDIEEDYVNYPYTEARIQCRHPLHATAPVERFVSGVREYMKKNMQLNLVGKITSYSVVYANMAKALVSGQMQGLLVALIALWLTMSVYFRSIKVGSIAIIPNMLPISFTLGTVGWLGIDMNIATAMISCIAIGLALDDTIHYFARFRDEIKKDGDYEKATLRSLKGIGSAMIFSSAMMASGFIVLVLSDFRLVLIFGALNALTVVVALFSDVFITTTCLATFKPKMK